MQRDTHWLYFADRIHFLCSLTTEIFLLAVAAQAADLCEGCNELPAEHLPTRHIQEEVDGVIDVQHCDKQSVQETLDGGSMGHHPEMME